MNQVRKKQYLEEIKKKSSHVGCENPSVIVRLGE